MSPELTTIAIEGGDGVGKNTLQLAMADLLLQSDHKVALMNFPQYWFLGSYIRRMLKDQFKNFFQDLEPEQELRARAALFSLDRAVALNSILQIRETYPDIVVLSDRGPWSNTLTAAYMAAADPESGITAEMLESMISELDQEMFAELTPQPLLCRHDRNSSHAFLEREHTDNYERADVQEIADDFYCQMIPAPNQLITRTENTWHDLGELAAGGLSRFQLHRAGNRLSADPFGLLSDSLSSGRLQLIGPRNFLAHNNLQPSSELEQLISEWETLTITPDSQLPPGTNKKDSLNPSEHAISAHLVAMAGEIDLRNLHVQPSSRAAIGRLTTTYPEILSMLEHTDQEYGPGMRKLLGYMGGTEES